MSRCTIGGSRECKYSRPVATCAATCTTDLRSKSAFELCTRSNKELSALSITTQHPGGDRFAPKRVTMLGWHSRACTSSSSSSARSAFLEQSCSILAATGSPFQVAAWIAPIAPCATGGCCRVSSLVEIGNHGAEPPPTMPPPPPLPTSATGPPMRERPRPFGALLASDAAMSDAVLKSFELLGLHGALVTGKLAERGAAAGACGAFVAASTDPASSSNSSSKSSS
mmetsp:Transcript_22095/g.71300  ORF Transcript_22095/g.71300 Transcript_22095/m.71300 type:complete len:226 (-) Transcript_22095:83-760(-)